MCLQYIVSTHQHRFIHTLYEVIQSIHVRTRSLLVCTILYLGSTIPVNTGQYQSVLAHISQCRGVLCPTNEYWAVKVQYYSILQHANEYWGCN